LFVDGFLVQFERAGYSHPTAIQSQAWPIALQGRDLVAIANTGSGKTCGFLIPAFLHIQQQREQEQEQQQQQQRMRGARGGVEGRLGRFLQQKPTYALVVAPTRELAQQIEQEAVKFGRPLGIKTA
jgi:ATP-dependent RNA helicase DDX5/DBP2